jgi:uroporphyrinogen III methyltransferase/synthase
MAGTLHGVRVLVTRARAQAGRLSDLLRERGASVVEVPLLELVSLPTEPLDAAVRRIDTFTDVVVTSANAADALRAAFERTGAPTPDAAQCRLSAVGPSTSQSLAVWWRAADLVPPVFVAESLVAELTSEPVGDRRFLIPQAAAARDVVVEGLRTAGATVEAFAVYETRMPGEARQTLEALDRNALDVATATSSSTVRHLAAAAERCEWLREVPLASIGPITSATARESGFRVAVEANASTVDGLVEAIETAFASRRDPS